MGVHNRFRVFLGLGLAMAAGVVRAEEAQPDYGPPPAWVKPPPPDTRQAPPAGALLQVLMRDSQAKLGPEGDAQYLETRFKLLTPEALDAGNLNLVWDPQVETLAIHRLTVTHDGKVTDVLAAQKFTVVRREQGLEAAMLDGRLTATLQIPGLQVGDVIDLAITTGSHDPLLAGHSQFVDLLPTTAIAGRLRERATWPAASSIAWRASDDLPKSAVRRAGGAVEALFEADGLPAPTRADGAPARFRVRRLVQASGFADWREISALMAPLYASAATPKPDSPLKAEAAKIRAASADPAKQALAALQLVQDQVRYVYVGLDSGAYRPAAADETWSRRFGDCKAKTALLLALLSELGIKAEPVLANASGLDGLDYALPQLGVFNHVLVRAEVGGRTLWLDGTRSGDSNLVELEVFPYGVGLPVHAGGGGDLEKHLPPVPFQPVEETVVQIDARAGLHAPAQVTARFVLRGDEAFSIDREVASAPHDEAEQVLKKAAVENLSWFEPKSVTWSYDARRRLFLEEVRGEGKVDWSKDASGGHTLWYQIHGSGLGPIKPIKRDADQDQTAPFAVAYPSYSRWVTTIRLPQGIQTGRRGDNVATTLGGMRYVRRLSSQGDTVTMYHSLRSMTPEITAAEAAADEAKRADFKPGAAFVWAVDAPPKPAVTPTAPPPPAPQDAKALLAAGYAVGAERRYDEALALADRALAAQPGWADAQRLRALVLVELKRWPEAADAYAAAVSVSEKPNAADLRGRVQALTHARKFDEAEKAADIYVLAFPRTVDAYEARAGIFEARQDYDRALAATDDARQAGVDEAAILRVRSNILWAAHRREDALAAAEAEIKLDPDSATALSWRGLMEARLKRFDAARDDLRDAERMNPENETTIIRLAELEEFQGRYAQAVAIFDAALARWPKSAVLLNGRCWSRALWGEKLDLAARDCDDALAVNSTLPSALDSRAFVSFRQKNYADAVTRYNAALAERPESAASLYGRGLAKLRAGDKAGGEADLAAALKLDPDAAESYLAAGLKP
ncbi:DUF3857 domain-containing protein [Phenylobacterium sp.]|uniref:tetratricopeptide repeat protein n=1 Tax=Phenylobacterium sp. TaxID=1871053 RepID=UPI001203AAAC|nr:DUF3857 domain-containing protein [Phenylobacterium sp.]THD58268.1 MAG: tetratricopeptide repeat protein [Phenylobacterium sp.]